MNIYSKNFKNGEAEIPSIIIEPKEILGSAIVLHGYGDCKEKLLGFSQKLSEKGFLTITIDLRGHGENSNILSVKMLDDVNFLLEYSKKYGKTAVVGHSMGGRIALLSKAEYKIGLAPALCTSFGCKTTLDLKAFKKLVNDGSAEDFLEIFYKLPIWDEKSEKSKSYVLYAEDDKPEITEPCKNLVKTEVDVIKGANHSDIYLYKETHQKISDKLLKWFS